MTDKKDIEVFFKHVKHKIVLSVAIVMIRFAHKKGVNAEEFTKRVQEEYLNNRNHKISPGSEHKLLSQRQNEVLGKLKKAILPEKTYCAVENCRLEFRGKDSCDSDVTASELKSRTSNYCKISSAQKAPILNNDVDYTQNMLHFLQAMNRLKQIVNDKLMIASTDLHPVLFPDDYRSEVVVKSKVKLKNKFESKETVLSYFEEDSGIYDCSESISQSNEDVKYVSGGVLKYIMKTSNTDMLILNSLKSVIKFVENEVKTNTIECFRNWKGSLIEYAVCVLTDCSHVNHDCFSLVYKFVTSVLQDMWVSCELNMHKVWEYQIYILSCFCENGEMCKEILEFLTEKLNWAAKYLVNVNNVKPSIVLMREKLYHIFQLYLIILENLVNMKAEEKNKKESKNNDRKSEEQNYNVSELWKMNWKKYDETQNADNTKQTERKQVETLERLVINMNTHFPLISTVGLKCLQLYKELNEEKFVEM